MEVGMTRKRPAAPKRRRDYALRAGLVASGVLAMSLFGSGLALADKPAVNCSGVFSGATPRDPIVKTADKTTAIPGETVTYTIQWHSTGVALADVADCFQVDDGSDAALNALVATSNVLSVVANTGLTGSVQTLTLQIAIPDDDSLIGHTIYDRAKITNGSVESRSGTVGVGVVAPPSAPANVEPTVSCPDMTADGLTVAFTANAADSDGSITNYHWDFGDGSSADTATGSTSHTYAADGTYNVSTTVTDDDGATASAGPCPVTVAAPVVTPPNVAPSVVCPTMSASDLVVAFSASGVDTDGSIASYHWVFGDGSTADTATGAVSHTFATGGAYDVVVTVTDDDGDSASAGPCPVVVTAPATVGSGDTGDGGSGSGDTGGSGSGDTGGSGSGDTGGSGVGDTGGSGGNVDVPDAGDSQAPTDTVVLAVHRSLPRTGADAGSLAVLGAVLLVAGAVVRFVRPRPVRTVFAGRGSVAHMVEEFGLRLRANARPFRIHATVKM
jgi:PKD repeat protein